MATERRDCRDREELEIRLRNDIEAGDLSLEEGQQILSNAMRNPPGLSYSYIVNTNRGRGRFGIGTSSTFNPFSTPDMAAAWNDIRRINIGPEPRKNDLEEAKKVIEEQNEILTRIQKEPLIVHTIDRVSKDGKFTYYKKGEQEIRIEAPKDLKRGHEVLLHPKTFQIVEYLGFPPLEASEFAPSKIPDTTWDDIGGLEDAKRDIQEAIELPFKEKELFAYYNKRPIKGILLSGEPGCGKTLLAKAAANSLAKLHNAESVRTGFLYVKGPEILNMCVGATEQTIRNIFIDASRHLKEHGYPAIVFIDEADAILATRGQRLSGIGNTIVPAFLTEMDGLEESSAIIMLATNRPDVLDPAIIREGRIDRKIHVPRPSKVNALNIVSKCLAKFPIAMTSNIEDLSLALVCEIYDSERMVNDTTSLAGIPQQLKSIEYQQKIAGEMLVVLEDFSYTFEAEPEPIPQVFKAAWGSIYINGKLHE